MLLIRSLNVLHFVLVSLALGHPVVHVVLKRGAVRRALTVHFKQLDALLTIIVQLHLLRVFVDSLKTTRLAPAALAV